MKVLKAAQCGFCPGVRNAISTAEKILAEAQSKEAVYSLGPIIHNKDEVESYDHLYYQLPIIEYHLDILLYGTDQEKFDLYKGVYDVI